MLFDVLFIQNKLFNFETKVMKNICIAVTPELDQQIKLAAKQDHRTKSGFIRLAILNSISNMSPRSKNPTGLTNSTSSQS